MRKALITIAIIFSLQIFAQETTFEFIMSTDDNLRPQSIKETDDGSIFFVGSSNKVGSNHESGIVIKLNKYGELIDTLSISIPNRSLHISQVIIDDDNTLILSAVSYDTTDNEFNSYLEIFRLNNNLEILDSNSIFVHENAHISNPFLNFLSNGNIIVSGAIQHLVGYPPLIRLNYKLSPEFDSLYSYFRFSLPGGSMCWDVKQLNDTTLFMFTTIGTFTGFALTDTMFVETGELTALPNRVRCDCGIKWDSDTSFFLLGVYYRSDEDHQDIGILRSLNPMDTSAYSFNYWGAPDTLDHPTPFGGIDYNNKDTIYASGTKNAWVWPLNVPSYYSLVQTDSLLNIRWEKFYGGDANYTLFSIDATQDGGCLLGGIKHEFSYPDLKTDAHVLKVNAQGLITGLSDNSTFQIKEALVFPNPGTEFLRVRIAAQYPQSIFELFDMNGNLVLRENIEGKWKQIGTSFLPKGTYVYKIHNQDGLFESGKWVKQ